MNLFMHSIFLLITTSTPASKACYQEDCRSVGSINEYSLTGHTYRTIPDKQVLACVMDCDVDTNCYSINYKFATSTCELSDTTRVTNPEDFIYTPDALYLEHLYRPSGSCYENKAPCKNDGTCVNIPQRPGYRCFCRKDYIGELCEACSSPAIGLSDGRIPNSQIQASSEGMWFPFQTFKPHYARLNGSSSWVAGLLDALPWLQINLQPQARLITRVATQANPEHDWWTTSYTLKYSLDGTKWKYYKMNGITELFLGNIDRNTVMSHDIIHPFVALFVRFYPVTNRFRSALRVELFGCEA